MCELGAMFISVWRCLPPLIGQCLSYILDVHVLPAILCRYFSSAFWVFMGLIFIPLAPTSTGDGEVDKYGHGPRKGDKAASWENDGMQGSLLGLRAWVLGTIPEEQRLRWGGMQGAPFGKNLQSEGNRKKKGSSGKRTCPPVKFLGVLIPAGSKAWPAQQRFSPWGEGGWSPVTPATKADTGHEMPLEGGEHRLPGW